MSMPLPSPFPAAHHEHRAAHVPGREPSVAIFFQRLSPGNPWRDASRAPEIVGSERVRLALAWEDKERVAAALARRAPPEVTFRIACTRCFNDFEVTRRADAPPGTFSSKNQPCPRCAKELKALDADAAEAAKPPDIGAAELEAIRGVDLVALLPAPEVEEPPSAEDEPEYDDADEDDEGVEEPAEPEDEAPPEAVGAEREQREETNVVGTITPEIRESLRLDSPWVCGCGASFDQANTKALHAKACDGKPWPKPCPGCGKVKATRGAMATHRRTRCPKRSDAAAPPPKATTETRALITAIDAEVAADQPLRRAPKPAPAPEAKPVPAPEPAPAAPMAVIEIRPVVQDDPPAKPRGLAAVAARYLARIEREEEDAAQRPDPLRLATAAVLAAAERLHESGARFQPDRFAALAAVVEQLARGAREAAFTRKRADGGSHAA